MTPKLSRSHTGITLETGPGPFSLVELLVGRKQAKTHPEPVSSQPRMKRWVVHAKSAETRRENRPSLQRGSLGLHVEHRFRLEGSLRFGEDLRMHAFGEHEAGARGLAIEDGQGQSIEG